MARTPLEDGHEPSQEVGYGRPPAQHQIQDGEKRNPWGSRGKPKPPVDFLDETVTVQVNGKARQVPRREALDYFLFSKASKGDVRAIQLLETRARQRQSSETEAELPAEDQPGFEAFLRRAASRLAGRDKS